jgi:hypothetical protein
MSGTYPSPSNKCLGTWLSFLPRLFVVKILVLLISIVFVAVVGGDMYWCWEFFCILFVSCAFMCWSPLLSSFVLVLCQEII